MISFLRITLTLQLPVRRYHKFIRIPRRDSAVYAFLVTYRSSNNRLIKQRALHYCKRNVRDLHTIARLEAAFRAFSTLSFQTLRSYH